MYSIIGLGLIGGAIARKLDETGEPYMVYDSSESAIYAAKNVLKNALYCTELTDAVPNINDQENILIIAAPLRTFSKILEELASTITAQSSKNFILTDVGSTKRMMNKKVEELGLDQYYMGLHPMAGNQLSGFESSDSFSLDDASWAITYTEKSKSENPNFSWQLAALEGFVANKMNGAPIPLEINDHDDITALISHIPHIVATEIANMVETYDQRDVALKLSAGSFKDGTRVASTDPRKTESMVLENSKAVAKYMRKLAGDFEQIATAFEAIDDESEYLEEDDKNAPTEIREFFRKGEYVRKWRREL